ncbi:MAG TPA: site-specific integrase [Acidimicrobiales bacterium]|nr:site-specific integrase [Acidimicrobiales bacterium]
MPDSHRAKHYRKKPLAVFEHGTRIYAPSGGETRFRVVATDPGGGRAFHKFADVDDARIKARELEAYLATHIRIRPEAGRPRTVATLAEAYLEHVGGRSLRYQERQAAILSCWVLPCLGDVAVSAWTPVASEQVLNAARARLAPASVQGVGSVLRSLVTFAHKSRWLPREIDPMWTVRYTARPQHQGQVSGFVPKDLLPNDIQCAALFDALVQAGQPTWALAMRLAHRCGARWGELIALRPCDIDFEPHRSIRITRAVEQSARGRRLKAPKNGQARGTIFPASLSHELATRIEEVRREAGDGGLLFPGRAGGLAERRQFLRLWHRAAKHAGWPMINDKRSVWHPHDLRHVAACWMLFDVGIDGPHVARMLGHANASFTLSRYVGVRSGADATTNSLTDQW